MIFLTAAHAMQRSQTQTGAGIQGVLASYGPWDRGRRGQCPEAPCLDDRRGRNQNKTGDREGAEPGARPGTSGQHDGSRDREHLLRPQVTAGRWSWCTQTWPCPTRLTGTPTDATGRNGVELREELDQGEPHLGLPPSSQSLLLTASLPGPCGGQKAAAPSSKVTWYPGRG